MRTLLYYCKQISLRQFKNHYVTFPMRVINSENQTKKTAKKRNVNFNSVSSLGEVFRPVPSCN
jgi:hypothetical protein